MLEVCAFGPASMDNSLAIFLLKLAFFFPLVDPTFVAAAAILPIYFLDSVDKLLPSPLPFFEAEGLPPPPPLWARFLALAAIYFFPV